MEKAAPFGFITLPPRELATVMLGFAGVIVNVAPVVLVWQVAGVAVAHAGNVTGGATIAKVVLFEVEGP